MLDRLPDSVKHVSARYKKLIHKIVAYPAG